MEMSAIIGIHLAIWATLTAYIIMLKSDIKHLKKENEALTKLSDSLLSGRSDAPNPFPT
jgi:hypothetical protein